MLVKYWMSTPVVTVSPNATIGEAVKTIRQREVRMLPVMSGRELVGIVTEKDLMRASPATAMPLDTFELLGVVSRIQVKTVMTRNPVRARLNETMEEAAHRMLTLRIGGLPVMDENGGLTGILTRNDILRVLTSLTGTGKGGVYLALITVDRPGCIKVLTDIIRSYGGRLVSILTSHERVPPGRRRIYLRIYGIDRPSLDCIRQRLSEHAELRYLIDPTRKIREIYC